MLSAAHALAMDAKNLLDVVDGIRIRHPEVTERLKGTKSPSYVSPDPLTPQADGGYVAMGSAAPTSPPITTSPPPSPVASPNGPCVSSLPAAATPAAATPVLPEPAKMEIVHKVHVEQPIYCFATKVPPALGPEASVTNKG